MCICVYVYMWKCIYVQPGSGLVGRLLRGARSNQVLLSYTRRHKKGLPRVNRRSSWRSSTLWPWWWWWNSRQEKISSCERIGNHARVEYTRSYYTCSGCDTAYKKYGNLMKHIERPIFPRHNQSALTLIVVQKTENHRLYFTVFRSVESNMEIWKLQCASTLGCSGQNTAPQKPTLPTFLKHQKFAIQ